MEGLITKVHDRGDAIAFERVQDVEPHLNFAKRQRDNGDVGSSEMRHAASLPMVLVEAYCNDKGIKFEQFMADPSHIRAMVNDPALKSFRIWPGRV